ncbi:MAG: ABC transporter ATP-binding protein, partial [Elusimicrobia bacterium]|nr:ABC transporter ATP-binding protein [Elusimicrobiota bacterium]
MAEVEVRDVHKKFAGGTRPVLDGISFTVKDGEFVCLLGPSGCGKTTLLRIIAGLEVSDSGKVLIGGGDVTDKAPKDRDIAMVFQNYALYPH